MPRRKGQSKKIRIFKRIKNRVAVCCNINDPNRALMIKFKYDTITDAEFEQFHNAVKKLIYKAMHSNQVMMEWDDIYQEIWQKIIRSKHTWKENKGTFVSTWITIVAHSVLNTLRQGVIKRNTHICLYDDLKASPDSGESTSEMAEVVLFHKGSESFLEKIGGQMNSNMWSVDFQTFMQSLTLAEKTVIKAAFDLEDEFLSAYYKGVRKPFAELRHRTGYDETTLVTILNNARRKYESLFNTKLKSGNEDCRIDGSNETLF